MNPVPHWHSDGLRWIASTLNELADFMDRTHSAPAAPAPMNASDACDEARGQARYRVPFY